MVRLLNSKRAQVFTLVIVLAIMAVLAGSAYLLSTGKGSEISGFATLNTGCGSNITTPGSWTIGSSVTFSNCPDYGIMINVSDVVLDCGGKTIDGNGIGSSSFGIMALNGTSLGVLRNVAIKNCVIKEFYTGIQCGIVIPFVGGSWANYCNFTDNTISSTRIGIGVVGNYSSISQNSVSSSENALWLYFSNFSNITKNDLTGAIKDLNISGNSGGNQIWLNNFNGGGVLDSGTNIDYCIDESDSYISHTFGNYYAPSLTVQTSGCTPTYLATLPAPFDGTLPVLCGAEVIGDLTLTGDLKNNTPGLMSGWTCPGTALLIGANDVNLDCAGHNITGIGSFAQYGIFDTGTFWTDLNITNCNISNFYYGIYSRGIRPLIQQSTFQDNAYGIDLVNNANNFNVTNNHLFNNDNGILINTVNGEISDNTLHDNAYQELSLNSVSFTQIMRNTFENKNTSGGVDLYLSSSNSNNFFLNRFIGQGFTPSGTNSFCYNSQGNFYKYTLTPAAGDCGPITYVNITQTLHFYNVSSVPIEWKRQNSVLPIWYYVRVYNASDGDYQVDYTSDKKTSLFSTVGVLANTSFNISINPWDGFVNGTYNYTTNFTVTNDADNDQYSVLDYYKGYDSWDCNDTNDTIHPPFDRENDTALGLCFDTVDDDCDSGNALGGIDWLDYGCGHGFTTGSFDSTLYINGTIRNLSKSQRADGSYYVLVSNADGSVEYSATATDLRGVDFDDYFTITPNSISVNPSVPDSRFNKSAKVTFKGLSEYRKVPVVLVDGVPCQSDVCTNYNPNLIGVFTNNISFTASHFSVFTTTSNSMANSFTQAEPDSAFMAGYPVALETYHRLRFFVNYSRYPSGAPVNNDTGGFSDVTNGGSCNITLIYPNGTAILGTAGSMMEYDRYYGVYKYESGVYNFTSASGFYSYNISCNSTLYEPVNRTDTFTVATDSTPPIRPILYPQILIPGQESNFTLNPFTDVAGYFNESDITYTIVVLHGIYTYNFNGTMNFSADYSEYKGTEIIINFNSNRGENVTFTAWNPEIERALQHFHYVEFSNHNRTYFNRYYVVRANRTGDDIRIEFDETLEEDVDAGNFMHLYTSPHPAGYFRTPVSLFPGSNRIAVWGVDQAGNSGNASNDWINAPYPTTPPTAPILWPLPEAWKYDPSRNLSVIGFINVSSFVNLNMTLNFIQGYNFSIRWYNESYNTSSLKAESVVNTAVPEGNDFFYISKADYTVIGSAMNFTDSWVEFSNHNRTHWMRYDVTNTTNNPGEPARIYVSPRLERSLDTTVSVGFYDNQLRHGFFNISVNASELPVWNGSNVVYALAIREGFIIPIEGAESVHQSLYHDIAPPLFNTSGILSHYPVREPTLYFNVSDDYKVNMSSLLVNVSNSSWFQIYNYSSVSCSDVFGNHSSYSCSLALNRTENGTYDVNVSVYDLAGWFNSTNKSMTIQVTKIDVTAVYDEDDITNDLWLYFNWTTTGGELDYYEFALGTAKYPNAGFDSIKPWNTSCAVFGAGNCGQKWINFTHDSNVSDINSTELKMRSGLVYYLSVRAKNRAGEYGTYASSDGILFIDPSPPQFRYIDDHGPWTKSNSRLSANWLFEDNESDIIEYMYALGNKSYPEPGYNSIIGPVLVTNPTVLNDGLSLRENGTYYYSVKARNGNVAMNYSGSWSAWQSSNGVTVDTYPPSGGFVQWQNATYASSGFVTVHYKVGYDLPGTSDNVKGLLEIGKGLLDHDICEPISDFDWYNTSHVLPLGGDIDGEGYTDVNVTSGYCYVFRLFAWDNATNHVTYEMQNETLRVVKVDTTPPSDVAPVIDDGFYTNSRTSLHARWTASTDPESSFDHYSWRIVDQPVAGFPFCVVNTTAPGGTNCSEVAAGRSTTPEMSVNWLNLTHNHKYYFEVTPWNKVPLNYTTRYSDGIIYIDNAAPGGLFILTVNDANESHSPFPTTLYTNVINVTAVGDLDGYNDIANCVLLADNLDYREDSYAVNCTEYPHSHYYNETYPDTTKVNCIRNTSSSNATAIQGNFSWYLSCKDHYGNYNTFAQNTRVWFNVDWPEPPVIELTLGNSSGVSPVYASDNLYCTAAISDPEHDLNSSNITFSWFRNGDLIARRYKVASDPELDGEFDVEDTLAYTYLRRGNNITCQVNASDERGMVGTNSSSVLVRNTRPYDLVMVEPRPGQVIARNSSFTWTGPYDDVDHDFFTLEIHIDKDGTAEVPVFNYSNNPLLSFKPEVQMTVGSLSIPGVQRNADVYGTKIVYEDDRSGTGDWDIYIYDIATDEETPIATSPDNQHNPKIYGEFVLYEQGSGATSVLYRYNISSSVTTQLVSSINSSTMDFFGRYFSYNDGGGVRFRDVFAPTTDYGVNVISNLAVNTVLYGKNLLWVNSDGTVYLYDMVNSSSAQIDASKEDVAMFGSRVVMENGGVINVTYMLNGTSYVLAGENMSIYGGLLAYVNSSGEVVVADLLSSNIYNRSLGTGNNPAIYDQLVVFERGNDLYYARRNITLPATFIFEEDPIFGDEAYTVDTTLSPDNETYFWAIKGCDNSFASNSCVWGLTSGPGVANFTLFNIDNTAPTISSVSPSQGSVVAGMFRVFADITDVNDVPYVNYTILYRNNRTLRNASTMTVESGTAWHSSTLDFRDINVSDFTLTIWAKDEKDNWNSAEVNFTVNNNTAWFLFGTGDDEIVNGKVFDTVINSDFIAFNVFTSTIRIVGPLPATTVRSIQSKTNLTITNHNYSDPISTLTWPDGSYRAEFTGNTFDGTKTANRTFYVDKNAPVNSSNSTSPSPLYANSLFSIGINWTDITLAEVKFTYNNTNRSNPVQLVWNRTGNYLLSGYFNITGTDRIDVSAYINRTFGWNASARDGRNRNSSYVYGVFVNDNPPRTIAVMPDVNMTEDTPKPFSSFLLSTYFDDPNTVGTWGYLDNLTYSFDSNCSAVSFAYNATGGRVFNVTSTSNFTGYCNVRVNATDFYSKRNSSNFTLYVSPVNDYPTIDPIPDVYTTEDNASGVNYTLVKWDVDGDATTWLVEPGYDHSVFNMTWNNTALSMFNFTLMPDAFGDYNITFRVSDGNLTAERNATVHITGENDAPVIGTITYPGIGNITRNTFTITWTNATDKANEHQVLNYSLEYSINGGTSWNVPSGCAALYQNLSCSWNSLTDIVGTENVTLRLNVTDGLADDPLIYGNFTVDNQGPVITINKPTTVMVGASFVTDINTTEPASCSFAVNGSATLNQSSTYLTTLHTITVSGYAYNTTYNLSMTCIDNVGNAVPAYRLFEPRASAFEFIRAYASPTWIYQGQIVNLTLELAANNTWSSIADIIYVNSSASGDTLDIGDFSPEINASRKITYLNNAAITTTAIGKYNLTIVSLYTNDGIPLSPMPIIVENIFEVFEAVNQTLNVN